MLIWNRRTQTLLSLAIGSSAATLAFYSAASDLVPAHPTLDTVIAIVGGSMPFVFCASLFAFIVTLGDDQSRLARAGRVTAAIMAILWPGFVYMYVLSYTTFGWLLEPRDVALLAGMPVVAIIGGYFGFRN